MKKKIDLFDEDVSRLAEQLVEASMAIGFVVLLLERSLVQLLQTESAHKMFGMEFLKHGRYAAACDRLGAAST